MAQKITQEFIDKITQKLSDEGLLVEAGWVGFETIVVHPNAPPIQRKEMKTAFFAGALHLFSSIMNILDPGAEPTEADLKRMDLIDKELREFDKQFKESVTT